MWIALSTIPFQFIPQISVAQSSDPFEKNESSLVGEAPGKESKDFFTKGSATSVFDDDGATLTTAPELQILNSKRIKKSEAEESQDPKMAKEGQPIKSKKSVKESLLEKYGDPGKDLPIVATDNSPKPLRAVMDALQGGDEEVALKYSRQYVRYLKDLDARSKRVADLNEIALQREGSAPRAEDSEEPDYEGLRYARRKDLEEISANTRNLKLDERVKEMLAAAEAEEDKAIENSHSKVDLPGGTKQSSDAEILASTIAKIRDSYPRDPEGKARVYLFIDPSNTEAKFHLQQINEWYNKTYADPSISIVAFSISSISPQLLKAAADSFGIKVPLRSGGTLATKLGIRKSPTFVFIAATTGEAVVEEGAQRDVLIENALKRLKGQL